MSIQLVRKWCREFCAEQCEVHDKSRTGHPKMVIDESVNTICVLLNEDHRSTLRELETIMNEDLGEPFSQMSISSIVTNLECYTLADSHIVALKCHKMAKNLRATM